MSESNIQLKEAGRAFAKENYSECLKICEHALAEIRGDDKNKILFLHLLADVYLNLEEYVKAIETLSQLIAISPSSIALNNRAWALREVNRLDESVVDYQNALKLDPNNLVSEKNLGECFSASGNSEAVINLLRRHMDNKKQYADIYRLLGDAFVIKNKISDAYDAYCLACCLNHDDEHSIGRKQQIEKAIRRGQVT